jgi:hypothetical protein
MRARHALQRLAAEQIIVNFNESKTENRHDPSILTRHTDTARCIGSCQGLSIPELYA